MGLDKIVTFLSFPLYVTRSWEASPRIVRCHRKSMNRTTIGYTITPLLKHRGYGCPKGDIQFSENMNPFNYIS